MGSTQIPFHREMMLSSKHLLFHERGVGTISSGKMLQPVGISTVSAPGPKALLKLSQYRRADDAPAFGSQ